jgi:hypothetical protein
MDRISATLGIFLLGMFYRRIVFRHSNDTQGGFVGPVFDSYGPSGLMICGTVLYFLSAICTSFSTGYQHYLLSQGVLFGVSVGLL